MYNVAFEMNFWATGLSFPVGTKVNCSLRCFSFKSDPQLKVYLGDSLATVLKLEWPQSRTTLIGQNLDQT